VRLLAWLAATTADVVCLQERRANDVGVEPAAGLGALRWSEHAPVTVEYG
jgi:exonuclease III